MHIETPEKRKKMAVLVDGATGYLGSHLVHALTAQGDKVHCLVHRKASAEDISIIKACGSQVFAGDLIENDTDTPLAFSNVDVAVHLIGTIAPKKGEKLESLHAKQTQIFVDNCQRANTNKIILISALGTQATAISKYHRTKWLAEEMVRKSGIPYVILQPSLIVGHTFGRRDSKLVRRYLEIIANRSNIPLIAGGGNKIQPIFINDLVQAIVICIKEQNDRSVIGQTLELGGSEILTMRQFVTLLMELRDMRKRLKTVPVGLAKLAAFFCEHFQSVPTLSKDQILLSLQDNICSSNSLNTVFGMTPTSLKVALDGYR